MYQFAERMPAHRSATTTFDLSQKRFELKFGQIYLSRPNMRESDGSETAVFPQETRSRNTTYSAPLYIDVTKRVLSAMDDGSRAPGDLEWKHEEGQDEQRREWIGMVCIVCTLHTVVVLIRVRTSGTHYAPVQFLLPSDPF